MLGGILAKNPSTATAMAHLLLKTMSQEKRDDLLVQLAGKHRDKILEKGRDLLEKKEIKIVPFTPAGQTTIDTLTMGLNAASPKPDNL